MFGNGFGPSGPPDNVSTLFLVPPFSIKGVVYSVKCGGKGRNQPRKRWEKNREKRKRRICEIKRVKTRVKWWFKEPKVCKRYKNHGGSIFYLSLKGEKYQFFFWGGICLPSHYIYRPLNFSGKVPILVPICS
jgi:hypothetical protein